MAGQGHAPSQANPETWRGAGFWRLKTVSEGATQPGSLWQGVPAWPVWEGRRLWEGRCMKLWWRWSLGWSRDLKLWERPDCETSPKESCTQGSGLCPKEDVAGSKAKGRSHSKHFDTRHGAIGFGFDRFAWVLALFWSRTCLYAPFLPSGMGICLCSVEIETLGFYCCDKTPWQKTTWRRKGLVHPRAFSPSPSQAMEETWRPGWTQRPWGMLLTGSLLMFHSACLLLPCRTTCPWIALPTVALLS